MKHLLGRLFGPLLLAARRDRLSGSPFGFAHICQRNSRIAAPRCAPARLRLSAQRAGVIARRVAEVGQICSRLGSAMLGPMRRRLGPPSKATGLLWPASPPRMLSSSASLVGLRGVVVVAAGLRCLRLGAGGQGCHGGGVARTLQLLHTRGGTRRQGRGGRDQGLPAHFALELAQLAARRARLARGRDALGLEFGDLSVDGRNGAEMARCPSTTSTRTTWVPLFDAATPRHTGSDPHLAAATPPHTASASPHTARFAKYSNIGHFWAELGPSLAKVRRKWPKFGELGPSLT